MLDFENLAEQLGPDRGTVSVTDAAAALRFYAAGNSAELASRETGISNVRIMRWVEKVGIKRSKAQTEAVRRTKALSAARGRPG